MDQCPLSLKTCFFLGTFPIVLLHFWKSQLLNVTFVLINQGFISLEHHVKKKQENVTCTNLEPFFETPLTLQIIPYIFSPCTELAVPGCTRQEGYIAHYGIHKDYAPMQVACAFVRLTNLLGLMSVFWKGVLPYPH